MISNRTNRIWNTSYTVKVLKLWNLINSDTWFFFFFEIFKIPFPTFQSHCYLKYNIKKNFPLFFWINSITLCEALIRVEHSGSSGRKTVTNSRPVCPISQFQLGQQGRALFGNYKTIKNSTDPRKEERKFHTLFPTRINMKFPNTSRL